MNRIEIQNIALHGPMANQKLEGLKPYENDSLTFDFLDNYILGEPNAFAGDVKATKKLVTTGQEAHLKDVGSRLAWGFFDEA